MKPAAFGLFALIAAACSKSDPPQPVPVQAKAVASTAQAATDTGSGSCDLGFKCTEWTGHIAPKKAACGVMGSWTTGPCADKANAVGECAIRENDLTGTIFYGAAASRIDAVTGKGTVAENDCSRFSGVYRARADAGLKR